jgi:hypothetical protein
VAPAFGVGDQLGPALGVLGLDVDAPGLLAGAVQHGQPVRVADEWKPVSTGHTNSIEFL